MRFERDFCSPTVTQKRSVPKSPESEHRVGSVAVNRFLANQIVQELTTSEICLNCQTTTWNPILNCFHQSFPPHSLFGAVSLSSFPR